MNRFLLDTHIWIWYVTGSADLPRSLRGAIDGALGQLWLSPISIWEAGTLVRKGRFRIRVDYREWARKALDELPVTDAPLTVDVARRVFEIELPHGDPADYFLAATAQVYRLTLMTVDQRLIEASWLDTMTA